MSFLMVAALVLRMASLRFSAILADGPKLTSPPLSDSAHPQPARLTSRTAPTPHNWGRSAQATTTLRRYRRRIQRELYVAHGPSPHAVIESAIPLEARLGNHRCSSFN